MPIRAPGQPGPRMRPPPERHAHPLGHEASPFEVMGCHSSRDGLAAITLRDKRTGAVMSLQRIPFEHHYGEGHDAQCRRIQAAARELVSEMSEAMCAHWERWDD